MDARPLLIAIAVCAAMAVLGAILAGKSWRPLAFTFGLATVEMGCAFIIGSGIKRSANPFGSVCEPSRSIRTSYWKCCCTGKVTWQQ